MQKHTLAKDGEEFILLCNGSPCRCPFVSPAVIYNQPTIKGGAPIPSLVGQNCKSDCPHFSVDGSEHADLWEVKLTCGNGKVIRAEEEPEEKKEKPQEGKLIKLS